MYLVGLCTVVLFLVLPAAVSAAVETVDVDAQIQDEFTFTVTPVKTDTWLLSVGWNLNEHIADLSIETTNPDEDWSIKVNGPVVVSLYSYFVDATSERRLDGPLYWTIDGSATESAPGTAVYYSQQPLTSGAGSTTSAIPFYLSQEVTYADFEAGTDLLYETTLTFEGGLGLT